MNRKKIIYVTNVGRLPAFRYAHPRAHAEPVDLYLFDYIDWVAGGTNAYIDIFENWQSWNPGALPKAKRERISDSSDLRDLYKKIARFGKQDPGSLIELHFFTHGIPEAGVSFSPMGEQNEPQFQRALNKVGKDDFKAAFSRDALVKLWGCASYQANIQQQSRRKLTLSYWVTSQPKSRKKIQAEIESYLRGTYAFRLSRLLDLTIWATPLGWSSSMDVPANATYIDYWDPVTGPDPQSKWWRVDRSFLRDCGSMFYQDVLKAKIDPVGYVGINDAMSQAAQPAEFISKPVNSIPGILRDYPGRAEGITG